jgi:hypothetical protein
VRVVDGADELVIEASLGAARDVGSPLDLAIELLDVLL